MNRFAIFLPQKRPRPQPAVIAIFCLLLLTLLLLSLRAYRAGPILFDLPLERDVQGVNWLVLSGVFNLTNWLGSPLQASITVVVVAVVLGFLRTTYEAILSVSAVGANAIETLMKQIVDRPRPPVSLVHVTAAEHGFSFPSGHATFFAAWLTTLYLVLAPRFSRSARLVGGIVAALLILLAGLARVEVGVHWPTDIIGGYLLATAWILLVSPLIPPLRPDRAARAQSL